MDNLIICERCGSDACYVTEVNEKIKNYFCYGCGFQTNTLMTKGSELFEEQIETLPNLYKELMGEDENGKIWMPTSVNVPSQGMVFANGKNSSNWKWAAVLAVPVKEEEAEKYPIPGKKGEYYKWRMDMNTLKEFEENDFIEALEYIGVFNSNLD
jgi:hypothetical protein